MKELSQCQRRTSHGAGAARSSASFLRCLAPSLFSAESVTPGIALLVGVLAAAIITVPPTRDKRIRMFVVGVLFALSISLGAFLAQWPLAAIIGIALVAFAGARLT
jgi:hypothetical protein